LPQSPFFIVGCVRSGTTFLRDVLCKHPNLASPQETHFYRWADPFGAPLGLRNLMNNVVLKKHRELDGISEAEFDHIVKSSTSRADLCTRYMNLYIEKNKPGAQRWFDKTPQNVYGAPMIAMEFPKAKLVHIVRDPIDVAASLRIGVIVKVENIVGACNYWNEAAEIIAVMKRAFPKRVYELRYEDFTANFLPELEKLMSFLGEEYAADHFKDIVVVPKQHEHGTLFSPEELQQIAGLCGRWAKHYGYDLPARAVEAAAAPAVEEKSPS
jgi:hypothetical protein